MLVSSSIFLFLFLPLVPLGYYGVYACLGRFRRASCNLLLFSCLHLLLRLGQTLVSPEH